MAVGVGVAAIGMVVVGMMMVEMVVVMLWSSHIRALLPGWRE